MFKLDFDRRVVAWGNLWNGFNGARKILISGVLGFFVLGFFGEILGTGGLVARAGVPAEGGLAACVNITGETTAFPAFPEIANSGVMDFDLNGTPEEKYRACARDMGEGNPIRLEGWVLNDNLGWVSFYCDQTEGANKGKNLGIACGDQAYGVTVDKATGILSGFAWGDNTGWISFNCVDVGNGDCGVDYKVTAATEDAVNGSYVKGDVFKDLPHAPADAFAWSDNVKWFDFSGINIPLDGVEKVPVPPSVTVSVLKGGAPYDPAGVSEKSGAVLADGVDAYTLMVEIKVDDELIENGGDYSVNIVPVWQDTVKLDQTVTSNDNVDYSNSNNVGAVTKPLGIDVGNGGLSFVNNVGYSASITSVAPTSNMNVYEGTKNGVPKIYKNEQFTVLKDKKPAPNNLILESVNVQVEDLQSGKCLIPAGDGPCAIGQSQTFYPNNNFAGIDFKFAPAVDLTVMNRTGEGVDPNVIAGKNDLPGSVSSVLINCEDSLGQNNCNNVTFNFGFPDPNNSLTAANSLDNLNAEFPVLLSSPFNISNLINNNNSYDVFFKLPCNTDICLNPFAYSTVNYASGKGTVTYYSAKLPRGGGQVLNPVAFIKGSVYSTGVTNVNSNVTIKSLGDVATNILRDSIFRNVSNIIAGAKLISDGSNPANLIFNQTGWSLGQGNAQGSGQGKFLLGTNGQTKVFYYNGDIYLKNGGFWTGEKTIISIGGNVFIDEDLYNAPAQPGLSKPKLGIIVLKDLKTGRGGNVYLGPNVKNVQANIFADGSVFAYDGEKDGGKAKNINLAVGDGNSYFKNTHYGEPCFDDEDSRKDLLKNQLYFEGSIASLNTIGGSAGDPRAILGNGVQSGSDAGDYGGIGNNCKPTGRARAKLYDLNYLRYFGYAYEINEDTAEIIDQQNPADGINQKPVDQNGDLIKITDDGEPSNGLVNDPNNIYGVVISFDPPTSTLPGFGAEASLNLKQRAQ